MAIDVKLSNWEDRGASFTVVLADSENIIDRYLTGQTNDTISSLLRKRETTPSHHFQVYINPSEGNFQETAAEDISKALDEDRGDSICIVTTNRSFITTHVQTYCYRGDDTIINILSGLDITMEEVKRAISKKAYCGTNVGGLQINVSKVIPRILTEKFSGVISPNRKYPTASGRHNADCVMQKGNQKIFWECEFRPNVEKDLVKFTIAHKRGELNLGILIVAERGDLNPGYTTMPGFESVKTLVNDYSPDYPILLLGMQGFVHQLN